MKNGKKYELEFIITYNKEIYNSKNPNEECLKLVESGKHIPQNIFSLKLSKSELTEFLNLIPIIEWLYDTDVNFNDIWKVSMCVYRNNNDDLELPQWFNECNGKLFDLQYQHNQIQQMINN